MGKEKRGFSEGFAAGFVISLVLCFIYFWITVAELKVPIVVPVEVYKYNAPKRADRGDPARSLILKYGVPDRGPETLSYLNHVVGYDQSRRIPLWVAEHITTDHIKGDSDRDKCHFKQDTDKMGDMFSSTLDDYSKSGYDRGHMSPAANHKYSQDAMCESFILTNVVPQTAQYNRYYWKDVEEYCRELAQRYDEVRVITGPLFLPELAEGATQEDRFVKYEVIGESNVTVPTHFFKAIVVENATDSSNTTIFAAAFLIPHKQTGSEVPLINFKVPLAQLEAAAGIRFFPRLADAPVGDLCSIDPCKLRGESAVTTYSVGWRSSGVLLTSGFFVWVFLMYKWKEQVQKAQKKK